MKRRRGPKEIALLLALAAAALLGALLLGGSPGARAPAVPRAGPSSELDRRGGAGSVASAAPDDVAAPEGDAVAGPGAVADAHGGTGGRGAAAAAAGAKGGAGLGRIDGVVVDPFGPVVGIAVAAGLSVRPEVEVFTDPEGRFAFDVPAGEWPVCVGDGSHRRVLLGVIVTAGQRTAVRVEYGGGEGRLIVPPAFRPEDALIHVEGEQRYWAGEALPDGRYRVRCVNPDAPYCVEALLPGLLGRHAISFEGGPGLVGLPDIALSERGAAVRGRVVGRSSARPLAAHVSLAGPSGTVAAEAGPDGGFVVRGVPPGRYALDLELAGEASCALGPIAVGEEDVDLGALRVDDRSSELRLMVVDAGGTPAANARVVLREPDGTDVVRVAEDGAIAHTMGAGRVTVFARSHEQRACGALALDVPPGEEVSARLVLGERAGSLRGTVTGERAQRPDWIDALRRCDAHGEAAPHDCVGRPPDEGKARLRSSTSDPEPFRIEGLRPGSYVLFGDGVALVEVEVRAEIETHVDLPFPSAVGDLRLQLIDPPFRVAVSLRWSSRDGFMGCVRKVAFEDHAARRLLESAPAGPCEVVVAYPDAGRHVQFRAGRFVADPARELVVRCWPEGPSGGLRGRHPLGPRGYVRVTGGGLVVDVPVDASGGFELAELPAGPYRVIAGTEGSLAKSPLGPEDGVLVEVVAGEVTEAPELPLAER